MRKAKLPCHVTRWSITKKQAIATPRTPKEKPAYIPNRDRAVCTGTIVTVKDGRRVSRFYISGEPLEGRLQ